MEEEWRDVVGYEGLYQVSNMGDVRKVYPSGHIKVLVQDRSGDYLRIKLTRPGERFRCFLVHRLVALAFIRPAVDKETVNHKNGHKRDNRVENLEYLDRKQHFGHTKHVLGIDNARKGEQHGMAALTEGDVLAIRYQHDELGTAKIELSRKYGVSRRHISRIVNRVAWSHVK